MITASIALILLFGLLTLVSYVDRLYQEIGKFLSRDFPGQPRFLRAASGTAPRRIARARVAFDGDAHPVGYGGDRYDRRLHRFSRPRLERL